MAERELVRTVLGNTMSAWKAAVARADKFFKERDQAELEKGVAPGRNRIIYLWGHLAATHDRMLELLGSTRSRSGFDEVFLSKPDRALPLPPSEEIAAWWDEVSRRLDKLFEHSQAETWMLKHSAVSAEDFEKDPRRNRLSILISRTNHLAYHTGQLMLVRL